MCDEVMSMELIAKRLDVLALRAFDLFGPNMAWLMRSEDATQQPLSYAQLKDCVAYQMHQIHSLGLQTQAKIGVFLPNGPEWSIAALAIWCAGGILVPLHTNNTPEELAEQLAVLDLDAVFAASPDTKKFPLPVLSISLSQRKPDYEFTVVKGEEDDLAALFYTSGSTGKSKVVQLSHRNLVSNVLMSTAAVGNLDQNDRFMVLLPYSHAMGLTVQLLVPLYLGASMVAPSKLAAKEIIDCLSQSGVTVMLAVPQLYRNMMRSMEKKFASNKLLGTYIKLLRILPLALKKIVNRPLMKNFGPAKLWGSGGSRLDPQIMKYYNELGVPLVQGYGLTETSPILSIGTLFDNVLDTVGIAVPGVETRLVEARGYDSKELWVRGENIMLGYTDSQLTSEVIVADEKDPCGLPWLRTGDLVTIDEHGRIAIVGRSKRLIVTETGKNVYPEDLEVMLEQEECVKEACVVDYNGHPGALVAFNDDVLHPEDCLEQVIHRYNQKVAPHKKLHVSMFVEALPRTSLGKISFVEAQNILSKQFS